MISGVLFLWVCAAALRADSGGDIQITCEPDVRIWLNEDFKGKTTVDDNGLYIEHLPPGKYTIKAAKTGYQLVHQMVEVKPGETVEVRLTFSSPGMRVEDLTHEKLEPATISGIGDLILRSVPLHADIYLDGRHMGKTDTKISKVTAGRHTLTFVYRDQTLEDTFQVGANQTLKLKAHFKQGRIINELHQEFVNTLGMKFNFVAPGYVRLGLNREKEIFIDGFFIQTTEVTQQQWYALMNTAPFHFTQCGEDCPAENISYFEAEEFVRRLNQKESTDKYRLPAPSEWEYACRTGKDSRFCCGDSDQSLTDYAWYKENSRQKTHPVAQKQPSEWGLYDMHGNVQEWCRDYLAGLDPVARGGDFSDPSQYLSCYVQEMVSSSHQHPTIGFRLVRIP
jgi:hypothetical protein